MAAIAKALLPEDLAPVARYYASLTPPKPAPLNIAQASRPQFITAGTTPSTTVGSDTSQDTGTGIESAAPSSGGEHGLATGGAPAVEGRAEGTPGASAAPQRGLQTSEGVSGASAENAARGRALIANGTYNRAACHTIPGIRAPRGIVGPHLAGFARRPFIAGQLPNTSDVLVAFLQNPPALVAKAAMPNVGLSLEDVRHIAAYLYTMEPH